MWITPRQTMQRLSLGLSCGSLLMLVLSLSSPLSLSLPLTGSEKMFQGSKLANYSTTKQLPTQTNRQRLIHKAKMKSLRISVVIIIAFLICWTPYYVMMIIFLFWNPDKRASMPSKRGPAPSGSRVRVRLKLGLMGHCCREWPFERVVTLAHFR